MRQVKGNIFNGDSYKAIFARAIYKRLMSREWVTLAAVDLCRSIVPGEMGGIVHCYSYSVELARTFLDMGVFILELAELLLLAMEESSQKW